MSLLTLLHSSAFLTFVHSTVYLPNSCLDQDDGSQWLKLMADDTNTTYPAIRQICHNEYMVIDVNEDPNVKEYFSSFTSWHYAISGPEIMDSANWEEWWLPSAQQLDAGIGGNVNSEQYFEFAISPDCSTCDATNNIEDNSYSIFNEDTEGDRTAYYMTGNVVVVPRRRVSCLGIGATVCCYVFVMTSCSVPSECGESPLYPLTVQYPLILPSDCIPSFYALIHPQTQALSLDVWRSTKR